MLFVNYPKCSTCRRARKWLEERNIPFEDRDIKTQRPSEAEWEAASGDASLK